MTRVRPQRQQKINNNTFYNDIRQSTSQIHCISCILYFSYFKICKYDNAYNSDKKMLHK
jgi:hypothetical protein